MRHFDILLRLPVFGLVLQEPSGKDSIDRLHGNRRVLLRSLAGSLLGCLAVTETSVPTAAAAETVGKDPDCNDTGCLGVWDGLLADCPHGINGGAGCTSSQDDTPGIFSEP
jgi:hypothetical protein